MVQVADLYAWIVRRYAEIVEYERTEEFSGEAKFIDDCVKMLRKRRLGVQCVGLRDPQCSGRVVQFDCAQMPSRTRVTSPSDVREICVENVGISWLSSCCIRGIAVYSETCFETACY